MTERPTRNRRRRRNAETPASRAAQSAPRGLAGGRYLPLSAADLEKIDTAVRAILIDVESALAAGPTARISTSTALRSPI